MADLPVAAIVCIAVGCYLAIIIGLIMLCYFLKGRGRCGESQCCAKGENSQSCECCIALAEACNCCKSPSLKSCLDSCCPNRKHITCVDIIMCQCCSSGGSTLCDCCGGCQEQDSDPDICQCCCLEIRLRSTAERELKIPPAPMTPLPPSSKPKPAWLGDPSPFFRSIPALGMDEAWGSRGHRDHDLQLDLAYFGSAPFAVSTLPLTSRSDGSGELVPTSTPRFHQGRSQLFIRPGVHSAGRVIAKRQSQHWPSSRRSSSRRRSSRRGGSPQPHPPGRSPSRRKSATVPDVLSQSPSRRRSTRTASSIRPLSRRQSQREVTAQWEDEVQ